MDKGPEFNPPQSEFHITRFTMSTDQLHALEARLSKRVGGRAVMDPDIWVVDDAVQYPESSLALAAAAKIIRGVITLDPRYKGVSVIAEGESPTMLSFCSDTLSRPDLGVACREVVEELNGIFSGLQFTLRL